MKKSVSFYGGLVTTSLFCVFVSGCSHFPSSSPLAPLLDIHPQSSSVQKGLPLNNGNIGQARGEHPGRNGALTPEEMAMARIAWQYFEKNYQANTGLVNAANEFPSTTMWDVGSYLGALVSAYELGVINKATFDTRLSKLLQTFNTLSLFRNLPHKVYNTQTLEKVTYANKSGEIGFSALDLGRLLIWLKIIKERYPEYSNTIDSFVLRWDFTQLIDSKGNLYGASKDGMGEIRPVQEGRLGYEEYAAKGFDLWGFSTTEAAKAEPYDSVQLYGIDIPYDARNPRQYYTRNPVVSESYLLDALEFNWDLANDANSSDTTHSHPWMAAIAQKIYAVQEARYKQTGILTARTEHQLDQKPHFVYDSIYSDGEQWATISEKGEFFPQFSAVALKAVFGLWAVWKTDYTDLLFNKFSSLYDPEQGFYEGNYENGSGVIKKFTANNNGIILETLLYKVQGKLLRFNGQSSSWDKSRNAVPHQ